jgi:hypothetical protein
MAKQVLHFYEQAGLFNGQTRDNGTSIILNSEMIQILSVMHGSKVGMRRCNQKRHYEKQVATRQKKKGFWFLMESSRCS